MDDTDSNIDEENTTPEPPSSTSYNIMSNPTSCVYNQLGGVGNSAHGDNNRNNERSRSRSPAARDEERTAVTNALVQSAKALSKVIGAKRKAHFSSRAVALMAHDMYSGNIANALPPLVPPPFPTTAKETAKTPAKAPARTSAQTPAKAPAKASTKASAKTPAQAPAKASAKTPAQAPVKAVAKTRAKVPAKAVAMTRAKVPAKAR